MGPLVIVALTQIVLPAVFLATLWRGRARARLAWLTNAVSSAAFICYVVLVGRWDWTSYYLRYVLIGLLLAAAVAGYRRVRPLPWRTPGAKPGAGALVSVLVAIAFVALVVVTIGARRYEGNPVRLVLPLGSRTYYVAQGGSSTLVNYHYSHASQRYALDIVALNAAGARARGLQPAALERYVIFGAPVRSPCDGTVLAAVDGFADQTPPDRDPAHPAGNHVVLACQGHRIELAHLQQGSVEVRTGAAIAAGNPIGRVGDSGNTSEPHLHIHAVRGEAPGGEPAAILIDGTFPVRNTLLRR